MNQPNQTHPFHLALARDCGWPLVTRDGRRAEVLKWESKNVFPLIGTTTVLYDFLNPEQPQQWNLDGVARLEKVADSDIFLSADYSDPRVCAAVQAAHEKLGMQVKWGRFGDAMLGSSAQQKPAFHWEYCDYRLAIHLPATVDCTAPGHNPDRLAVSQVGQGWRLLEEDEIKDREATPHIQSWENKTYWNPAPFMGSCCGITYRTRLSREALAKLDRPAFDPRNIPGFRPLLPTERNHRDDFTEADLPEGWRPLLKGEHVEDGVDEWGQDGHFEKADGWSGYESLPDWAIKGCFIRTRRPLPSPPKFVPWDFETGPMMVKVRQKGTQCKGVAYITLTGYSVQMADCDYSMETFESLLKNFVQLDGSPCGQLQQP